MAVVLNLGTNGNWAYEDASLLPYYVDANNKYNGVLMSALRAGIANRTTREGLLESMTVDIPRIDFAENANGQLLAEDEEEQYLDDVNDFSQSSWSKVNATITPNTSVSPDGSTNADALNFTTKQVENFLQITQAGISVDGVTYIGSLWLKGSGANIGKDVILRIKRNSGGTSQAGVIKTLTSEWVRHDVSFTGSSGQTGVKFGIDGTNTNGADSVLIYGANVVKNDTVSSYIDYKGTRAADTGITTGDISHLINSEEGILEVQAKLNTQLGNRKITLSDGTGSNRIIFSFGSNGDGRFDAELITSIGTNTVLTKNGIDFTENNNFKFTYKINEMNLYVNNTLVSSSVLGDVFPVNTLKFLRLSNNLIGSDPFFGRVDHIKIHDNASD